MTHLSILNITASPHFPTRISTAPQINGIDVSRGNRYTLFYATNCSKSVPLVQTDTRVHLHHEKALAPNHVVGLDEVGYGAWAGPIGVAAAYINPVLCPADFIALLRDSKKLSAQKRQVVVQTLSGNPQWGEVRLAWVPVHHILPGHALTKTLCAMVTAVQSLSFQAQGVIVDGVHPLPLDIPQLTLCKADDQSASVALASIVAKVARDDLMMALHEEHPLFGWKNNMGYGTSLHRLAISEHGLSPHHRPHYCLSALKPTPA